MADQPNIKIEDTPKEEEVVVEVPVPAETPKPDGIITTKRKTPIVRSMPLTETHGMTTEANRFRET